MRGLIRIIKGACRLIQRRKARYLTYLIKSHLYPKVVYRLLAIKHLDEFSRLRRWFAGLSALGLIGLLWLLAERLTPMAAAGGLLAALALAASIPWAKSRAESREKLRLARSLQRDPASCPSLFTSWKDLPVRPETRAAVNQALQSSPGPELAIGKIDSDGRILGFFGPIDGLPNIDEHGFSQRQRFDLSIVLINGKVLVRKNYGNDFASFLNEWLNLALLSGKANVPALHHVQESHCLLYKNLLAGKTIRDILVQAGAKILHTHTCCDTALGRLPTHQRIEVVWARGKAFIPACLSEDFFQKFESQIDRVHALKIAGLSLTYGNIIVDPQGEPWLIDFEGARAHSSTNNLSFQFHRDQDRVKYNHCYGRQLLTESSARQNLAAIAKKLGAWYAPIDFGFGLATRGFWDVDSGTGRWDYYNGPLLRDLVRGKRILDLGSNNSILPLMMLRAGAREVVGLEISPDYVECSRLVHRLFEWRDLKRYAYRIETADMLEILRADWGSFDIVTSFCSLYYLRPEDMAAVVRKAAQLAPMMIVQAKVDTRPQASNGKAEKSSLEFLQPLLIENGFPQIQVCDQGKFKTFSRPLIIARAEPSPALQAPRIPAPNTLALAQ